MKDLILTPEGRANLESELEHLINVRRAEVADRIRDALESGEEIAENTEFLEAKTEQEQLEQRIALLEERLRRARVVEPGDFPKNVVAVGTTVRLRDLDAKKSVEYVVAGVATANPAESKLSVGSPVGQAIIGRKKGETVEAETPGGKVRLKIMAVKPPGS